MMNKYISGIIHCLDTVPSLKKALVKAFSKVDETLEDVNEKIALTSGTLTSTLTLGDDTVLYKEGNIVFFNISVNGATISANGEIATLPDGFRPPVVLNGQIYNATDGTIGEFYVGTDGVIRPRSSYTNKNIRITAALITI